MECTTGFTGDTFLTRESSSVKPEPYRLSDLNAVLVAYREEPAIGPDVVRPAAAAAILGG